MRTFHYFLWSSSIYSFSVGFEKKLTVKFMKCISPIMEIGKGVIVNEFSNLNEIIKSLQDTILG